jgi:endonuclease/exonuclease/phosphatase family metal-dependent hydrolase
MTGLFANSVDRRSLAKMRVVTWNMGCGSPRFTGRYRKARDEAWRFLFSLEPDVVLLQEALLEPPAWVLAEGAFFPQVPAWEGQDAGTAVFVRGGAPATPRPLVVPGSLISAVDVLGIEGALTVVSVHVDTKDQKKNLRALVDILSPFAGAPVIIGGDLNACRHWDTVRGSNTYGWFFGAMTE